MVINWSRPSVNTGRNFKATLSTSPFYLGCADRVRLLQVASDVASLGRVRAEVAYHKRPVGLPRLGPIVVVVV